MCKVLMFSMHLESKETFLQPFQMQFWSAFSSSDDATGFPIQGKGSGIGIAAVPGSIKTKIGVTAWSDTAIVREIGRCENAAGLCVAGVPDLRDGLAVGIRPLQTPTIDRAGAGVIDRDAGSEATAPLAAQRIVYAATGPWLRSRGRAAGWCRCGIGPGGRGRSRIRDHII